MMLLGTLNPWRKNIFIDGGGNNGSSVRRFRKKYDPFSRFQIISFEPNPQYTNAYLNFKKHKLIQAALWDNNGASDFYLDRDDGDGSTIYRDKLTMGNGGYGTLDTDCPIIVQTIDLSNWIKRNLDRKDYLVIKLDIEGAEYNVLNKMIDDATIYYIKILFIEWHWNKIGISEKEHYKIKHKVETTGIKLFDWDAKGY